MNPWELNKICRSRFPEATRDALLVAVSSDGQPAYGNYHEEEEFVMASLKSHFSDQGEGLEGATLLRSVVKAISVGWSISEEVLCNTNWGRYRRSYIAIHLKKDILMIDHEILTKK